MEKIILAGPNFREAYDANLAHGYFTQVKEWVHSQDKSIAELDNEASKFGNQSVAFRTMLKFVQSENAIKALNKPVYLTLINPVYKETGRMQSRDKHPHGENSLVTKIEVIRYFESLNQNFKGRIFVVDDECPENSGIMAQEIINHQYPDSAHKVFFLGSSIDENDPDIPPGITHKDGPNRSVKGGAALFGMRKALKHSFGEKEDLHIIVDNDADLSVHPMQLGLLVDDIVSGKTSAIAGSRRESDSVALIGSARNRRGELFIKIWQHFLPQLAKSITDTNRAFKGFESNALARILPRIQIYTFPYQIELLQACISENVPLIKKGIAYLDSEAASTQSNENATETYLNQIHQIIDIARRYKTIDETDQLMTYFLSISEDDWRKIEADPPENLMDLLD